jgi:ferredoxin
MRIKVKKDLCCGAQLCMRAAPGIYRLDALGYNNSEGALVPQEKQPLAERGARACPESAISFEQE